MQQEFQNTLRQMFYNDKIWESAGGNQVVMFAQRWSNICYMQEHFIFSDKLESTIIY